ncbi:hypothetical protein J4418_04760 [Candidatus Woesearchaeota archaeon]|nr:hypothetical protein [Candidatus Woesearchaeota archaeon]
MTKAPSISRDTPLNELILRRYEKPESIQERELVRKLCLSLGMLQPGDSRDVMVDILDVLLRQRNKRQELTSEEIRALVITNRKKYNLPMSGIASSNIRRQLKRLRDIMLVEKVINNYRITEFSKLGEVFNDKLERYLLTSIIHRIKEYISRIDETYN